MVTAKEKRFDERERERERERIRSTLKIGSM